MSLNKNRSLIKISMSCFLLKFWSDLEYNTRVGTVPKRTGSGTGTIWKCWNRTEPNPLFRPFRNLLELLKPNLPEPIFSSFGFFGLFWFPKHNWKKITKMLVTVVMLSKSNLFKLLNEKSIIFCNVQLLTG